MSDRDYLGEFEHIFVLESGPEAAGLARLAALLSQVVRRVENRSGSTAGLDAAQHNRL
jgi:hypothetical protein